MSDHTFMTYAKLTISKNTVSQAVRWTEQEYESTGHTSEGREMVKKDTNARTVRAQA